MKKLLIALCLILALSTLLAPLSCAAGESYDTLGDWNIRIKVPEKAEAVLKGNEYYLYAQKPGSIPYVMLTTYKYSSVEKFLSDFTAYMQKQYADLQVTAEAQEKSFGEKRGYEIDYAYSVSGNAVRDRRVVLQLDGVVYLFCSKEVEARGMTVGTMLDEVVADCVFLSEEEPAFSGPEDGEALADAYLYCQEDGMPKYWLDLTGAITDSPVLHCYFRSGDPTFYESLFFLDLSTAAFSEGRIDIRSVTDANGFDHSAWFRQLTLLQDGDAITMLVERDESSLAGGAEDNILSGSYRMLPAGAGLVYQYRRDDGFLKYWLDADGDDFLLHAMFRSGDPEYYEEVFRLDARTAEPDGDYVLKIGKVYHGSGADVSSWFESLTLSEVQGAILMNVKRDERTLAGGTEDNILSGVYLFEPHTYLLPAEDGPCAPDQLGRWAQIYYFRHNGFFPPEADVEQNADGSFSVHLYEIVSLDGVTHTATSAWYTVDAAGVGSDDITGAAVALFG